MYTPQSPCGVSKWIVTVLLLMPACFSTSALADNLTFNIQLVSQLDPFSGDNRYADVWGAGDYAYIGSFDGSGVGIIDVSNPSSPVLTSTYNPASGGRFQDVKVDGNIGYFASENGGGVHIVDLSNPALPSLISQVGSGIGGYDKVHNVFIENGFLYEADSRTSTVKVFDVQAPDKPIFVRDIVTTDSVLIHDITVINNRLYSSGWGGTTDIYDVSNIGTSAPALLGSIYTGSNSHSNWVSADGTLLASAREISGGGIRLYDISNPASPVLTSTITAAPLGIDGTTAHNPVMFGDYLFVTWYQAGLQMFDISDPFNPLHIGAFDTFPRAVSNPDGNWGVYPFLGTDRILLSDVDGGLFVVRLLQADLVVSGIDMPDPVVEGFQLVYTIDITNNGPDPASNVILTDELPTGVGYVQATPTQGNCSEAGGTVTCLLGILADGASATVTVMATAITPGSWNNALNVIADEIDSNLTDNEVTLNSTVLPDQDGDGLDDDFETSIGTNPLLPDTDSDGLSDGDEVLVYGTNPTQRDSDGDGFGDDVELGVGTNANDPAGPWPSADGDLAPVGRYDGLVNVADYLVAQRMALGLIPQTALDIAHGDLQMTGTSADVIDIADVLLILQQVLNQP